MTAATTLTPIPRPTLDDVAHAHTDDLFDVIALINGARDRVDGCGNVLPNDDALHIQRLLEMAVSKLNAGIKAFDPLIE